MAALTYHNVTITEINIIIINYYLVQTQNRTTFNIYLRLINQLSLLGLAETRTRKRWVVIRKHDFIESEWNWFVHESMPFWFHLHNFTIASTSIKRYRSDTKSYRHANSRRALVLNNQLGDMLWTRKNINKNNYKCRSSLGVPTLLCSLQHIPQEYHLVFQHHHIYLWKVQL